MNLYRNYSPTSYFLAWVVNIVSCIIFMNIVAPGLGLLTSFLLIASFITFIETSIYINNVNEKFER
jgi:hypothetical protein